MAFKLANVKIFVHITDADVDTKAMTLARWAHA